MKFKANKKGNTVGMAVISCPEDLGNAVYEMTHHAMDRMSGDNAMRACEVAGSAALGALLNLALTVCKKPKHLSVGMIPKEEARKVFTTLRTETMVFASLVVAHQFREVANHDANNMCLVSTFGGHVLGKALFQWQKLYPDLNIDDYLEPGAADIAKKELNNPENHFNAEESFNGPFVLRNNGTIN